MLSGDDRKPDYRGYLPKDYLNTKLICKRWNALQWNTDVEERLWKKIRERYIPSLVLQPDIRAKEQCLPRLNQLVSDRPLYKKATITHAWQSTDILWRNKLFRLSDSKHVQTMLLEPGLLPVTEMSIGSDAANYSIQSFKVAYGKLVVLEKEGPTSQVTVRDIESGNIVHWNVLDQAGRRAIGFAFDVIDRDTIAIATNDAKINLYEIKTGKRKVTLDQDFGFITTMAAAYGLIFVVPMGTIWVFEERTGKYLRRIEEQNGFSYIRAFQDKLLIGYYQGPPTIIDLNTWERRRLPAYNHPSWYQQNTPPKYTLLGNRLCQSGTQSVIYDLHGKEAPYHFQCYHPGHFFNEQVWVPLANSIEVWEYNTPPAPPPVEVASESCFSELFDCIYYGCRNFLRWLCSCLGI